MHCECQIKSVQLQLMGRDSLMKKCQTISVKPRKLCHLYYTKECSSNNGPLSKKCEVTVNICSLRFYFFYICTLSLFSNHKKEKEKRKSQN